MTCCFQKNFQQLGMVNGNGWTWVSWVQAILPTDSAADFFRSLGEMVAIAGGTLAMGYGRCASGAYFTHNFRLHMTYTI